MSDPNPVMAEVLDAEALERLRALDPSGANRLVERLRALDPSGANRLVERVLGAYRSSLQRLLPQLQEARRGVDADAVRHAAHTLKSSSASVGALRLSQLCAEVEKGARSSGFAGVVALLDDLLDEAERVLRGLPAAEAAWR